MAFAKSKFTFFFVLFFGFFLLYLHNLSQSVYGGDVGDFITSSAVHGVAHAPGYPLFVFLGYLLVRIVPFFTPAGKVGLISVFSGALGISIFYLLLERLTKRKFISFISSLILGFSFFYWFYSEIAEVFALHSLFIIALFYLAFLYRDTKKILYGFLLFFVFGLSCTNHQTIIFLIPSLGIIIFPALKKLLKKRKKLYLLFGLSFAAGFLPYLYVPFASATHPVINWDNVHDIPTFLRLILRQDYGSLSAGAFDSPTLLQRFVCLKVYLFYLISQLTIPVISVTLLGYWYLVRKNIWIFIIFALAFFISGPLFLFYAGFPVTSSFVLGVYERFFIMPSIIFFIPFGYGLLFLSEKLASIFPKRKYALLFQIVFLIIPFALFVYNYPKTNMSNIFAGDTIAEDMLSPLPPHAVLVLSGDTIVFNTWYVHYVLHYRPDVLVYNIGGGIQETQISQKEKKYKKLNSTDALVQVLLDISRTRPVFSTVLFQPKKGKITWVPFGLAYQLYSDKKPIPESAEYKEETSKIWSHIHVPTTTYLDNKAVHNLTISEFPSDYSNALVATGSFFFSHYKDTNTALAYYKKALEVAPDNAKAYETLGIFYLAQKNNCQLVVANLSTAIDLNPFEKLPYFLLYNAYKTCQKNQTAADNIKTQFNHVFEVDFMKELKKNAANTL